ncbi:hypothetical protein ACTXT7_015307 [Hymenolepis weldensis]
MLNSEFVQLEKGCMAVIRVLKYYDSGGSLIKYFRYTREKLACFISHEWDYQLWASLAHTRICKITCGNAVAPTIAQPGSQSLIANSSPHT